MCMYSLEDQAELCYTEVQEVIKNPELMRENITDDLDEKDIQELLSYMVQFIADVDQHYFDKLSNIRGGQRKIITSICRRYRMRIGINL